MLALLLGQPLEDASAARVARQARGAGIELEPAALGGDRNAQGVAREQQLGRPSLGDRRPAGPAGFARAVNLQHALARRETARRGHFLDQRFDVGAEELERPVAGLADQVEVARVAIGVLEAERPSPKSTLRAMPASTIHCSVR